MRSLVFMLAMLALVPISLQRPIVGVLLYCWISFGNPHQLTYGMAESMPWAMILVVVTVVGCVVAREPRRLPVNAVTVPVAVFLVCICLTSVAALAPPEVVEAKWESTFKTFFGLLIVAAVVTDKRRIHALVWVMVISLGYYGVRGGIFTLMTGGAFRVWGPPNTMISDNNQIAAGLLVALPLFNYLRMQSPHRAIRLGLMVAMGLTLVAVLGSYSRGALVGVGAVALFLWLNSANKAGSGLVMVAVLAGALSFMPASWTDRMSTIQDYRTDESAEGRYAMWGTSVTLALARPLTGGGFMAPYRQSIVDAYTPGVTARAVHSIYFEVIGEHGFPTFFVWLSITLGGVTATIRIRRNSRGVAELAWCADLAKMVQVSIIAYLVAGALLSLCYWDFYFTVLVAVAAVDQHVRAVVGRGRQADSVPSRAWRDRARLTPVARVSSR